MNTEDTFADLISTKIELSKAISVITSLSLLLHTNPEVKKQLSSEVKLFLLQKGLLKDDCVESSSSSNDNIDFKFQCPKCSSAVYFVDRRAYYMHLHKLHQHTLFYCDTCYFPCLSNEQKYFSCVSQHNSKEERNLQILLSPQAIPTSSCNESPPAISPSKRASNKKLNQRSSIGRPQIERKNKRPTEGLKSPRADMAELADLLRNRDIGTKRNLNRESESETLCDKCGKYIATKKYKNHVSVCVNKSTIMCLKCERYYSKKNISRHHATCPGKKPAFKCLTCYHSFRNATGLSNHRLLSPCGHAATSSRSDLENSGTNKPALPLTSLPFTLAESSSTSDDYTVLYEFNPSE